MSATAHTHLLAKYFECSFGGWPPEPPRTLFVGARRFGLVEYYLEDIASLPMLPHRLRQVASKLGAKAEATLPKGGKPLRSVGVPSDLLKLQLELTQWVVLLIAQGHVGGGGGEEGRAVLIFVSGLHEIDEIASAFDDKPRFKVYPIHSEIPFDEQAPEISRDTRRDTRRDTLIARRTRLGHVAHTPPPRGAHTSATWRTRLRHVAHLAPPHGSSTPSRPRRLTPPS